MNRKNDRDASGGLRLPQPSSADLRGRQSVRATFKLSARAIDALSVVAVQLGIKQKSLFDHLIEDIQSLRAIASEVDPDAFKAVPRVQKTYVLSRRTLTALERMCKSTRAPRDALVEFSIRRLLPVIERERRRHDRRKEMAEEFGRHFTRSRQMLQRCRDALGEEDPLCELMESALAAQGTAHRQMVEFIERCSIIEEF